MKNYNINIKLKSYFRKKCENIKFVLIKITENMV